MADANKEWELKWTKYIIKKKKKEKENAVEILLDYVVIRTQGMV